MFDFLTRNKKYTVEFLDISHRFGTKVTIKAKNDKKALEKAKALPALEKFPYLYQITTIIKGCELEQPIWDYFNGFLR